MRQFISYFMCMYDQSVFRGRLTIRFMKRKLPKEMTLKTSPTLTYNGYMYPTFKGTEY